MPNGSEHENEKHDTAHDEADRGDTPELTDEEKDAAEANIDGAPEVTNIDRNSQGLP